MTGQHQMKKNPKHRYDTADTYDVTLTVTDTNTNEASDTTTALVTEDVVITNVAGGIGKVSAILQYYGDVDERYIDWNISVRGGLLGLIKVYTEGNVTFNVGGNQTIQTDISIIGFGKVDIIIDAAYTEKAWICTGFVFGPFVLGVKAT